MITSTSRQSYTVAPNLHSVILSKAKTFKYVIIGGNDTNVESVNKIFKKAYRGKAICVGRFGDASIKKVPTLGIQNDIIRFLQEDADIQKVVYVNSELNDQEKQDLMELCASKSIDFIAITREPRLLMKKYNMGYSFPASVITRGIGTKAHLYNRALKRLFDIVFSLCVIVLLLSWMIPLLAILIKLESKGPVFFIQRRTGYFNTSFPCIKFRSMEVNDECDKRQATKSDPRLTRVGAIIRRHNLDEFPQFINVLLGHMSVVGPRPHMLEHTRHYSRLINGFMIRHSVKPGITGWAQVNGYRGPTKNVEQMRNRVEHDIWYIKNWTFLLDLKCVCMTVVNFLKGDENAF